MTSPSISGHQRISLNDGNIFDSILMLQPKFPKDPAAAAAAAAAATAEDAAETAEVEDETAETADVAATASVAMMISNERKKKNFAFNFQPKLQ